MFYRNLVWYLRGRREFTKQGYLRAAAKFNAGDLDVNLAGRRCVVTGANSGIGLACTLALAQRGATVFMLCRNLERGQKALEDVVKQTGNQSVFLHQVDLADPSTIQSFVDAVKDDGIDVLINNAGCMIHKRKTNSLGLEYNFAVNTFGTFLITEKLIPLLTKSKDARVVTVSSGGMLRVGLEYDDLNQTKNGDKVDAVQAYSEQKRHQVVLTRLWAQKYKNVKFFSMHPGWADTPAFRDSLPDFYAKMKDNVRTPEQGADTAVWAAVAEDIPDDLNGEFLQDRQRSAQHLTLCWTTSTQQQEEEFYQKLRSIAAEHSLLS